MGKKACMLLILLALGLLFSTSASAEKFSISASVSFGDTRVTVSSRYINDKYSLFLPGNWDISQVYIEMTGQSRIRVGSTEIVSGQINDLSACLGVKQAFYNAKGGHMAGTLTVMHGSEIPSLYLEINEKVLAKLNKDKKLETTEGNAVFIEKDGSVSYDGPIASFKGRGNSTYAYSKKPYQLKLPRKADFCGMGKAKTWLLIANWLDLSLLRNELVMRLAGEVGMPFAIGCQATDVYINGNYNGLYLLTEKIQIGGSRINIYNLEEATEAVNQGDVSAAAKFKETKTQGLQMLRGYEIASDPEDISGGYILEIEKTYRFTDRIDNGFRTSGGLSVTVKEPTFASRAQVTYIGRLVSDFHKAVLAEDGISPDTGKYYADFIDMESWALKWWMEEISKNYDFMASSQFFFKNSDSVDSRLFAGPCWDYDLSLGNMYANNFVYGSVPGRDFVAVTSTKRTNLYRALYLHEDFHSLLRETYRTAVRPALAVLLGETEAKEGHVLGSFDEHAEAIRASSEMNFFRWPESLVKGYYKKSGTTNAQSVLYLKDFLQKRVAYLDSVWLESD